MCSSCPSCNQAKVEERRKAMTDLDDKYTYFHCANGVSFNLQVPMFLFQEAKQEEPWMKTSKDKFAMTMVLKMKRPPTGLASVIRFSTSRLGDSGSSLYMDAYGRVGNGDFTPSPSNKTHHQSLPTVDIPDEFTSLPTVDIPDEFTSLPTVDIPDEFTSLPTVDIPDEFTSLPTVDIPDETSLPTVSLPTVDIPDEFTTLPTVDIPDEFTSLPVDIPDEFTSLPRLGHPRGVHVSSYSGHPR